MPIARNKLPIDRDRYNVFRLEMDRTVEELGNWIQELTTALPDGEELAKPECDHAFNTLDSLHEARESIRSAIQWATGLVSEVKEKELI